jgi:hypothetical protein
MRTCFVVGLILGAVACGGGGGGSSGVSGSKQLGQLDMSEWQTLCEYIVEVEGGEGKVTECGDGVTVTTTTVAECVADAPTFMGCTATVANAEACAEAIGADPCAGSAACEPIFACVFGMP